MNSIALNLIIVSVFLLSAWQFYAGWQERDSLLTAYDQQEKLLAEVGDVAGQFRGILSDTYMLSQKDNPIAISMIEKLDQAGLKIQRGDAGTANQGDSKNGF